MKGIILAGGLGRRLGPLTEVTNKHLLPVWDRPMVFYPLRALWEAGIDDVMIVTGGPHAGDFVRLLGDGREFGFRQLSYTYQEGQGGIAAALALTEEFCAGGKICVVLGDNVFNASLRTSCHRFAEGGSGAQILLKRLADPARFGVAEFKGHTLTRIIEKPKNPPSPYAVIGIYFFDSSVFEIIRGLRPSARGELEIADVINAYLKRGTLAHAIQPGWWSDAGTPESLHRAATLAGKTWFLPGAKSRFGKPFDQWVASRQRR